MGRRALFHKHLLSAWEKTITLAYGRQLINSERGLQVFFCKFLLDAFDADGVARNRRLFVEPRLSLPGPAPEPRYPDIIVCNTQRIVGVVEIKYQPRGRPNFRKDIETFEWMLRHAADLTISNDRYLGVAGSAREYPLATDAVFCWAGVYRGLKAVEIKARNFPDNRFVAMHAVTVAGHSPRIVRG
ncbi:uncharacterized protein E1O_19820 [Burkholderiales bacterium GJ-E10]|nr:uncharacterized protein E1O_19820 [Burkholderiales bacterium GJ-E10]